MIVRYLAIDYVVSSPPQRQKVRRQAAQASHINLRLDNWYNSLDFSYRFHTKTSALYSRLGNRGLIIKL